LEAANAAKGTGEQRTERQRTPEEIQKQEELVEKLNSRRIRRTPDLSGLAPNEGKSPSMSEQNRPWALQPTRPVVKLSPSSTAWNLCQLAPIASSSTSATSSARVSGFQMDPASLPSLVQAQSSSSDQERPSTPYLMLLAAIEAASPSSAKQETGQQTEGSLASLHDRSRNHDQDKTKADDARSPIMPIASPSPRSQPAEALGTPKRKDKPSKLPRLKQVDLQDNGLSSPSLSTVHSCEFGF
jgi:hypothetical protein